jgi:hypothetical protein
MACLHRMGNLRVGMDDLTQLAIIILFYYLLINFSWVLAR